MKSKKTARIILLIEHKSYQRPGDLKKGLIIQLLEYQKEIYRRENNPIIPVVIYHGSQKNWKEPLTFQDSLEGLTDDLRRSFGKDILNFGYRLLNTHDLQKSTKAKSLRLWPILCILTSVWKLNKKTIVEIINAAKKYGPQKYGEIMESIGVYIVRANTPFTWDMLLKIEEENVEKEYRTMSLAKSMWDEVREEMREEERAKSIKKGMKEGRKEGRKEGMEKVALEMLKNNADIRFICKCTGFTREKVQKLKDDLK